MRSLNLIQLAGGVAVAGAVAAGTTAFTASGVANNITQDAGSFIFLGGTVSQSVSGAQVNTMTFTNTTPGVVTAINLGMVGQNSVSLNGHTVKVLVSAGAGTATAVTCTTSDDLAFVCSPGVSWTGITAVAITVT